MSQPEAPMPLPAGAAASLAALENLSRTAGSGLTVDRQESGWRIRLEGDIGVGSAAELQSLLVEGLASGKQLRLDLERAGRIDITVLQLAWAAGLESGQGVVGRLSEAAARVARDAGFAAFPGGMVPE